MTSSASVSATSAPTSATPQRCSQPPPIEPRPTPRSTSPGSTRLVSHAGAMAATRPASTIAAIATAIATASTCRRTYGGSSTGEAATMASSSAGAASGPDGAADGRQHQRFEHQVGDERGPAGAECRAHRQLAAAIDGARNEQSGHVQRRDDQEQDHRAEQQRGAGLEAAAPVLAHRLDAEAGDRDRARDAPGPRPPDVPASSACAAACVTPGASRAIAQAERPVRESMSAAGRYCGSGIQNSMMSLSTVPSNPGGATPTMVNTAASVRSGRPTNAGSPPKRLAQKRALITVDARRVGGEVRGGQQPAVQRAQAEGRKVIGRDALAAQALGAGVEKADGPAARRAEERVEGGDVALEVAQFGNRQRPAGFARCRVGQPDADQPLGVGKGHATHRHRRKKCRRSCGGRHADGGAQHGGNGQEGRTCAGW